MTHIDPRGDSILRPQIRPVSSDLRRLLSPLDMVAIGLTILMTLWPLVLGMAFAPSREDIAKGKITPEVARSGAPLHDTGRTAP